MNVVRSFHDVAFRWTPAPNVPVAPPGEVESKEERAARSLARLEAKLMARQRWRQRARVAALVAVPLVLAIFAQKLRGVL